MKISKILITTLCALSLSSPALAQAGKDVGKPMSNNMKHDFNQSNSSNDVVCERNDKECLDKKAKNKAKENKGSKNPYTSQEQDRAY